MGDYLAFACKTGSGNNLQITRDDFFGNSDSLSSLGPFPTINVDFNTRSSRDLTYRLIFSIDNVTIFIYYIKDRVFENFGPSKQNTQLTFTDDPITICTQQVTNPIGVVIKVTSKPFIRNGLIVDNQYAVSIGFNPDGNIVSQVIVTRSKSSDV